ncbi:MAG: glycosyltransferase [Pseudomonadota bacterium]
MTPPRGSVEPAPSERGAEDPGRSPDNMHYSFADGTEAASGENAAPAAGLAEAPQSFAGATSSATPGLPTTDAKALTLRPLVAGASRRQRPAGEAAVPTSPGLGVGDLDADPPDPSLLAGLERPLLWMRLRVIPWRMVGGFLIWATDGTHPLSLTARRLGLSPSDALFVEVEPAALDRAFARRFDPLLTGVASHRLPRRRSVRGLGPQRGACALLLAALAAGLVLHAAWVIAGLLALVLALNVATTALRLGALIAGWRQQPAEPAHADRPLPRVSLVIPLYREAPMIKRLQGALAAIDYPSDLMDVKLVVEADDAATLDAVQRAGLPSTFSLLVVPPGRPRTKPRALNYALPFCRGAIVGVLDAEDRPEARQLHRVVSTFAALPGRYGCVQCQLAFQNARETLISRCFQIEYAIWFDVLLRGWERLGLPVPLGGTSVYFRRTALEDCDGWDAHNVTEDADLGMRLFRRGWRTRLISSTTEEEANFRPLSWLRQRSRWLKGFALTWLCHMRAPLRLWREMGTVGLIAFNVLFLGGMVAYLAMPVFWAALAWGWVTGEGAFAVWLSGGAGAGLNPDAMPGWLPWAVGLSLAAGQAVMVVSACRALWRRRALDLAVLLPVMPFYWTLGAVAAWKAVLELFVAPTYWDKTAHGVSRMIADHR